MDIDETEEYDELVIDINDFDKFDDEEDDKKVQDKEKSKKLSTKPDVYKEDVTHIHVPTQKPPAKRPEIEQRLKFPTKPVSKSPTKLLSSLSLSRFKENSVTLAATNEVLSGIDLTPQMKVEVPDRIFNNLNATELTSESQILTEKDFNPPKEVSTPTRDEDLDDSSMEWTMTWPKKTDWSKFGNLTKAKKTSLWNDVESGERTPPLDETPEGSLEPPSDDDEETNSGRKRLEFSRAGSVYSGACDISRYETDFLDEDRPGTFEIPEKKAAKTELEWDPLMLFKNNGVKIEKTE